jgi:hypothetical protein
MPVDESRVNGTVFWFSSIILQAAKRIRRMIGGGDLDSSPKHFFSIKQFDVTYNGQIDLSNLTITNNIDEDSSIDHIKDDEISQDLKIQAWNYLQSKSEYNELLAMQHKIDQEARDKPQKIIDIQINDAIELEKIQVEKNKNDILVEYCDWIIYGQTEIVIRSMRLCNIDIMSIIKELKTNTELQILQKHFIDSEIVKAIILINVYNKYASKDSRIENVVNFLFWFSIKKNLDNTYEYRQSLSLLFESCAYMKRVSNSSKTRVLPPIRGTPRSQMPLSIVPRALGGRIPDQTKTKKRLVYNKIFRKIKQRLLPSLPV